MLGAMSAAENLALAFDTMTNDPGAAMRARRRESVDRALEAVEDMRLALIGCDREGFIVRVPTVFALLHCSVRLLSIACYIYFNYIEKPEVNRNEITTLIKHRQRPVVWLDIAGQVLAKLPETPVDLVAGERCAALL